MEQELKRIADALERIAQSVERPTPWEVHPYQQPTTAPYTPHVPPFYTTSGATGHIPVTVMVNS